MATLTVFSGSADGHIVSQNGTYSIARTGGTIVVDTTSASRYVGQAEFFGYGCNEIFLPFDTSALGAGVTVSAVVLSCFGKTDDSATDFTIEARINNSWPPTVTNTDYVSGVNLGTFTLVATRSSAGWSVVAYNDFADVAFPANINTTGSTYIMLSSDRHRIGTSPGVSGREQCEMYMSEDAGTTRDPKLTITYTAGSIDIQAVPASLTASAPTTKVSISPQAPVASFTASNPSTAQWSASPPSASVLFNMPDDDFPGFEDGFDDGTRVAWEAKGVGNTNFSALASLVNAAVQVQAVPATVTMSAISKLLEVLTAPPANTTFSGGTNKVVISIQSPASLVTMSVVAPNVPILLKGVGNVNFSGLASLLEALQAVPGNVTMSSLMKPQIAPQSPAALFTTSAPVPKLLENLQAIPANVNFSGIASLAEALATPPGSFSASSLSRAQFAPGGKGTVTLTGSASLTEVLTAPPGTVSFEAQAIVGNIPIQVLTPSGLVTFSSIVKLAESLNAPPANFTANGLSKLAESLITPAGRVDFAGSASLTESVSGRGSVVFTGSASLTEVTQVVSGLVTFSGQGSVEETLKLPTAGRVDFTPLPGFIAESVLSTPATVVFSAFGDFVLPIINVGPAPNTLLSVTDMPARLLGAEEVPTIWISKDETPRIQGVD